LGLTCGSDVGGEQAATLQYPKFVPYTWLQQLNRTELIDDDELMMTINDKSYLYLFLIPKCRLRFTENKKTH